MVQVEKVYAEDWKKKISRSVTERIRKWLAETNSSSQLADQETAANEGARTERNGY